MIKKSGFTLAELLIALGIVGLVAIIGISTMFNLVSKSQKNETKLKKVHYLTSKIVSDMVNNPIFYKKTNNDGNIVQNFNNTDTVNFKGQTHSGNTKFCSLFAMKLTNSADIANKCSAASQDFTDGETSSGTFNTNDGMTWLLPISDFSGDKPRKIYVDVDGGDKGKNKFGVDRYSLLVYKDGKIQLDPTPEEGQVGDVAEDENPDINGAPDLPNQTKTSGDSTGDFPGLKSADYTYFTGDKDTEQDTLEADDEDIQDEENAEENAEDALTDEDQIATECSKRTKRKKSKTLQRYYNQARNPDQKLGKVFNRLKADVLKDISPFLLKICNEKPEKYSYTNLVDNYYAIFDRTLEETVYPSQFPELKITEDEYHASLDADVFSKEGSTSGLHSSKVILNILALNRRYLTNLDKNIRKGILGELQPSTDIEKKQEWNEAHRSEGHHGNN